MGAVPSTPRGDGNPADHGDYLLGALVGEKSFDLSSNLWERLLALPLALHWSDKAIKEACERLGMLLPVTSLYFSVFVFRIYVDRWKISVCLFQKYEEVIHLQFLTFIDANKEVIWMKSLSHSHSLYPVFLGLRV